MFNMTRKQKTERIVKETLSKLAIPFSLFLLASVGVVTLTPLFASYAHAQPTTMQLATTGSLIIAFGALFLTYAAKIVGLNTGWLLLSVVFTSAMVILKFVLIPRALYTQTFVNNIGSFAPVSILAFLLVAIAFFALYAGVFLWAHRYYQQKVTGKVPVKKDKKPYSPGATLARIGILLAIGFFFVVSGLGVAILLIVAYVSSTFSYAQALIAGGGFVLIATTLLAILLSVKYLESAANQAIRLKKPALLTIAFWIGFSLLLSFHILWVIFMSILLSIWPFKTITPTSK